LFHKQNLEAGGFSGTEANETARVHGPNRHSKSWVKLFSLPRDCNESQLQSQLLVKSPALAQGL